MHTSREVPEPVALFFVEAPQIRAIMDDIRSKLPATEVMEDHSPFTGIHDLSVSNRSILGDKLLLIGKILQDGQHCLIDGFRSVAVRERIACRHPALPDPIGRQDVLQGRSWHPFQSREGL